MMIIIYADFCVEDTVRILYVINTLGINSDFFILDNKVNTSPFVIITHLITVILQSSNYKKFIYRNEGVIIKENT